MKTGKTKGKKSSHWSNKVTRFIQVKILVQQPPKQSLLIYSSGPAFSKQSDGKQKKSKERKKYHR